MWSSACSSIVGPVEPPLNLPENTTATRSLLKDKYLQSYLEYKYTHKRFSNHSKLFLDLSMHLANRLGFITFFSFAHIAFSFEMLYLRKNRATLIGDVSLSVRARLV